MLEQHSFQEVMAHFQRMCKYYQRKQECPMACPMNGVNISQCRKVAFEKPKETEEIVMAWAKEHPEPVYPTWGEWLESEGICFSRLTNYEKVHGFTIPKVFEYQIDGKTAFICGDRVNSPIPADIAQKLGIEPKEG